MNVPGLTRFIMVKTSRVVALSHRGLAKSVYISGFGFYDQILYFADESCCFSRTL